VVGCNMTDPSIENDIISFINEGKHGFPLLRDCISICGIPSKIKMVATKYATSAFFLDEAERTKTYIQCLINDEKTPLSIAVLAFEAIIVRVCALRA